MYIITYHTYLPRYVGRYLCKSRPLRPTNCCSFVVVVVVVVLDDDESVLDEVVVVVVVVLELDESVPDVVVVVVVVLLLPSLGVLGVEPVVGVESVPITCKLVFFFV